jgi:predicted nucleic acid-binding protein
VSEEAVVLDSDTLSELSRGNPKVVSRATAYLHEHGHLTVSAVSVFERLRGYHLALRSGKPFHDQLRKFEAFVLTCRVLPVDRRVAEDASLIWANLGQRQRRAIGDILIAATASSNQIRLATRNRRDFTPMVSVAGVTLRLENWAD